MSSFCRWNHPDLSSTDLFASNSLSNETLSNDPLSDESVLHQSVSCKTDGLAHFKDHLKCNLDKPFDNPEAERRRKNTLAARRSRERRLAKLQYYEQVNASLLLDKKSLQEEKDQLLAHIHTFDLERNHWKTMEMEYQLRIRNLEKALNFTFDQDTLLQESNPFA